MTTCSQQLRTEKDCHDGKLHRLHRLTCTSLVLSDVPAFCNLARDRAVQSNRSMAAKLLHQDWLKSKVRAGWRATYMSVRVQRNLE